jgi:hypothetical protein
MDRSSPGRGTIATLAITLFLLTVGLFGAAGVAGAQAGSTIYVDGGLDDPDCASDDYDSIQNAVDNATAGDTIVVCDGRYAEAVTVDKTLTIEANDDSDVVLNGSTLAGGATAITVEPAAAGTVIDGLAVTQFGTAVDVAANDTVVTGLVANDSDTGVAVSASGTAVVSNVTVRETALDNVTTGVDVVSADSARVSEVNVYRNLLNGSDVGVRLDGGSSVPLDVGVRQNLVANATVAGVRTTSATDPSDVRVTRNFLRDNALGVENQNGGTVLTAWLNHWGEDSGPRGGAADPVTGAVASGNGDAVSADVNFDPWLGKGACTDPQLLNVTDRTLELFDETVRLSELQPTCLWERAALPLRADDDDAATSVQNLQLFLSTTSTGDVPANRPRLSVYQQGESFDLRFESATGADVSRFAGNETQLLVVRGEEVSTDFTVGLDNSTGEGRLEVDAASVRVVDTPALDAQGELNTSFTPPSAGDYTFVLVTNDFGSGVSVDDGEIRVDGGISVVGVESVPVQNTEATGTTVDTSYPAGQNVTFQLDSKLAAGQTNHTVFLYNESTFADSTVTVEVDGDASEALSGDLSSADVTVERSIRSLNGFIVADVEASALGFEVSRQDRSGQVDPSPFVDSAASEFGLGDQVDDQVAADSTQLNGSVRVVQSSGSSTIVDVETFPNFSTGTYRWVYVAQQGSEVSSDTGEVDLTTPTPTPTPTPVPPTPTPTPAPGGGGGGGGGGGAPGGGGATGDVEVTDRTLLNDSVARGADVVVEVDLRNVDAVRGRITLTMTADGSVVAERTVTVSASRSRTVYLSDRFNTPGTYEIALNGVAVGSVTVTDETATPTTPTRTPTTSPPPTTSPSPTETPPPPGVTPTETPPPTDTPPVGPGAPSGTEIVISFVLVLVLLAAVGVVVYVLPA